MKSHTCLFLLKNVFLLTICTFLRMTTEYAIEMTDNLSPSHNKMWLLPFFSFFPQYKLFAYRRFTFNFISAGQIFRKR